MQKNVTKNCMRHISARTNCRKENMNEEQECVYMSLLLAGQINEAQRYRIECESGEKAPGSRNMLEEKPYGEG